MSKISWSIASGYACYHLKTRAFTRKRTEDLRAGKLRRLRDFKILWRRTLLDTRAFTVGRTKVRVQEKTNGFLASQFRRMLRSRAMALGFAVSVIRFLAFVFLYAVPVETYAP